MRAIVSSTSIRLIRPPHPMFTTSPASGFGHDAASRFACTMFATGTKSRVCPPSPMMRGVRPAIIASVKALMTAAYGLLGSCMGPKTLKYRRLIVERPKFRS